MLNVLLFVAMLVNVDSRRVAAGDEIGHLSPLTGETFWAMNRLDAPRFSLGGMGCAVPVTRANIEKNEGSTDIRLVHTPTGESKPMTTHASKASGPVWSRDGKWITFVAQRDIDLPESDAAESD